MIIDTISMTALHAPAGAITPDKVRDATSQIRIERSGTTLRIIASDGAVMMVHTIVAEDAGDASFAVNLPIASLKSLPKRGRAKIAWEQGLVTISHETGVQISHPEATEHSYPLWRRIFDRMTNHDKVPAPAKLDPMRLHKLHKAGVAALGLSKSQAEEFTLLQFGTESASVMCWEHSQHWVGLIMPMRQEATDPGAVLASLRSNSL